MRQMSAKTPVQIAVLNAHFSANLGDGLLSSCLMNRVSCAEPSLELFPVDLAARTSFSTLGGASRGTALRIIDKMPRLARQSMIQFVQGQLSRWHWIPFFRQELASAQAVILGGGNLIVDQDLNFPTKIHTALTVAQSLDLPIHIFGVGVGSEFSERGLAFFESAFSEADIRSVTVRDNASKVNWDAHFSEVSGHIANVVFDPGIASPLVWDVKENSIAPVDIAIGIMSPRELIYHHGALGRITLSDWYGELISELQSAGKSVRLFSNGSPEDTRYLLSDLAPQFPGIDIVIPELPEEIVRITAAANVTIAFRMHALIPAIVYGHPVLALEWDQKIQSLMERVGQPKNCISVKSVSGREAARLCLGLPQKDVDPAEMIYSADQEMAGLAARLVHSVDMSGARYDNA